MCCFYFVCCNLSETVGPVHRGALGSAGFVTNCPGEECSARSKVFSGSGPLLSEQGSPTLHRPSSVLFFFSLAFLFCPSPSTSPKMSRSSMSPAEENNSNPTTSTRGRRRSQEGLIYDCLGPTSLLHSISLDDEEAPQV
jgi:hypothetical protein